MIVLPRARATAASVQPEETMMRSAAFLLALAFPFLAACDAPPPDGDGETTVRGEATAEAADTGSTGSAPDTVTPSPRDTARAETYYVHLRPGTAPRDFARRHGLSPSEVVTDPRPGLVVRLTPVERDSLAADTLVRSLARRIHGGGGDAPRLRRLGEDSAVSLRPREAGGATPAPRPLSPDPGDAPDRTDS